MNQARSEEEEKERKRGRKDRRQEGDGKKDIPAKQKHIGGTKTRPAYAYIKLKNQIEASPSYRMWAPAPLKEVIKMKSIPLHKAIKL